MNEITGRLVRYLKSAETNEGLSDIKKRVLFQLQNQEEITPSADYITIPLKS